VNPVQWTGFFNLDAQPAGAYAYRLKMVDIDGKFTYSQIVALRSATDVLTIKVLPNPRASAVVPDRWFAGSCGRCADSDGYQPLMRQLLPR
jgi:hypothetical protein